MVKVVLRALELSATDMTIMEGLRTMIKQRQYVAKGASKTLKNKHLKQTDGFGYAVDIYPIEGGKTIVDWGKPWPGEAWANVSQAMKVAAKKFGVHLTWGRDWKNFLDGPHYQIDPSKAFGPQ